MKFDWELKRWTMRIPFVIAGQRYDAIDALWVTVEDEQGYRGRGETCGVDYLGESIDSIIEQLERARPAIEAGIDLDELQGLLPSGGARNGVDCALWDLKCRATGQDIWTHTGIPNGTPTATVYTIGIVEPAQAAALATQYRDYASLKIKADASGSLATIAAVRNARPDAHILIDANQSWTIKVLEQLESTLNELGVALVEQPLPRGADAALEAYSGTLRLAADESLQNIADLDVVSRRYQVANIKLDKTGGLTEALALARAARQKGLALMIGNMCGSSVAMAPALVIAQLCEFVDLDGPLLQTVDCEHALRYTKGQITPPGADLWGGF